MSVANQIQALQNLHATVSGVTTARGARVVTWEASLNYVVGRTVKPTTATGFYYEATVAGTSGASEPSWPTVLGNTVVDNEVTWKAVVDTDDLGLPGDKLSSSDLPLVITEIGEGSWRQDGGNTEQRRVCQTTVFLRQYNEKLHALAHGEAMTFIQRLGELYTDPANRFLDIELRILSHLENGVSDGGLGVVEYLSDKFYGFQFRVSLNDTEIRS